MVNDITASLETVQISDQDPTIAAPTQTALQVRHPRKHVEKSKEQIIKEIEDEFFTPSHRFSTEWLDKLQRSEPIHLYQCTAMHTYKSTSHKILS